MIAHDKPSDAIDQRLVFVCYVALSAVALIPFFAVEFPGIVDYPNHLARLHIERHIDDPAVAALYEVKAAIIPNLALDAINWALGGLTNENALLKGAIVGAIVVLLAAVLDVHVRLNRRADPIILIAPALVYNLAVSMGYVSYLIGAALAIVGFRVWLALEGRNRLVQLVAINLIAAVIFFCHIFAVAFFGILISAAEVERRRAREGIARAALRSAPWAAAMFAAPAFLALLAERGDAPLHASYRLEKIVLLIAPVWTWSTVPDLIVALVLVVFAWFLWTRRGAAIAPQMRLPLAVVLASAILAPSAISQAIHVDARLSVPLAFLLVASSRLGPINLRWSKAIIAGASMLVVARMIVATIQWADFDGRVREFRAAASVLAPGSSVLTAVPKENQRSLSLDSAECQVSPLYNHLASFLVIDRAVFNPFLFVGKGMQPLRIKDPVWQARVVPTSPVPLTLLDQFSHLSEAEKTKRLRRFLEYRLFPDYLLSWDRLFDYVIVLHFGCRDLVVPNALSPVAEGRFFTIFAVVRQSSTRAPPLGRGRFDEAVSASEYTWSTTR